MSRAACVEVSSLTGYYLRHPALGVPTERAAIRAAVGDWQVHLNRKLESYRVRIAWNEDDVGLQLRVPVAPAALRAVRLLAVYVDRSDLDLPDELPADLASDPVWTQASANEFESVRLAQVVVPDCWLPGQFDLTVRHAYPDGLEATFGSVEALRVQLEELNRTTFQEERAELETATDPAGGRDLLALARPGLAALWRAADAAAAAAVPMLLDVLLDAEPPD